jgi:hypothetical protein
VMEIATSLQDTRFAFAITFTVIARTSRTSPAMTVRAGFILSTVHPIALTPALRNDDRCLSVRVRYANILATGI